MADIKTDIETIESLEKEWKALLLNSSHNNLFLSWEWISSWCIHMLKKTETPVIITARDGGKLVGIAPLLREKHRFLGDYYHFIGQQYSYHLGFISERGSELQVYEVIWDHLFKIAGKGFSEIGFIHLRDDSFMDSTLRMQAEGRGYITEKRIQNPCAVLTLPDSFESYLRNGIVSKKLGEKLRRYLSRLNRENLMVYYESGMNDFDLNWSEMLNLHRAKMDIENRHSVLQSNAFPDHLKNIASLNMENNSTKLGVLKIEGKTAAILLGIIYQGCFNAITIGIDPQMQKKYKWFSICVLLNSMSIKSAIENQCSEFDFLGGKHEFKCKMGGIEKDGIKLTIFRSTFQKWLIKSVNWFSVHIKNNFVNLY